jgi:hypothetical protein
MGRPIRAAGVPAREIAKAIPPSRFLSVDGTLAGEDLREAFARTYPKGDPARWFMESPVHDEGRTWIVTKMWGRNTEPVLERLIKLRGSLALHVRGSGSASCLAALCLAGGPPGYGGDRRVGLVQRLRCPGRRITALGGQRQAMYERPGQRQGDGQQ